MKKMLLFWKILQVEKNENLDFGRHLPHLFCNYKFLYNQEPFLLHM